MAKLYRKIFIALTILVWCGALGGCRPSEDAIGNQMVAEARSLMEQQQYDAARDTILSLRQNHPTAIEARREAILLLDSVELLAAQDSLARGAYGEDSTRLVLKLEFYTRKIEFDKGNASQPVK